jgi:DNA-binding SARP family transcriptional activator
MTEITLLGGVFVGVDGVPLSGEAGQHRRVALLVLLAAAAPRPVSRDRLIGCLWPDHDPESARHLLSSALYVLRRALGADALHVNGDDVSLDSAAVRSDVAEFRQALAAGDPERALSAYRGDFLDGFFVNDAADFTHWADGERAELRRQYGAALERVARLRSEAGDAGGAAEAWRRRAALDPYDAGIALSLMRALVAADQRNAAIQHARVHAALVEQEFGAAADAKVEAFAADLRQRAADPTPPPVALAPVALAPTSPAPDQVTAVPVAPIERAAGEPAAAAPAMIAAEALVHASAAPSLRRMRLATRLLPPVLVGAAFIAIVLMAGRKGPMVVGVRPFQSDDTALVELNTGLAFDVLTELPRIGGIRAVSLDVAFRTVGLTSSEANELLHSDAVLNVKWNQGAGGYEARIELTGPDGVNIISGRVEALTVADLPDAIIERLAGDLGRSLRPRSPSLLAADSADPRARVHYAAGHGAWFKRTTASLFSALDHFQQAVRIDSTYARAWAGLAQTLALLGSYDYAGLAPSAAFPDADRFARLALELDPSLGDAYAAIGLVQTNYSWQWGRAEANFRRAMRGDGDRVSASEWYALLLAARGRLPEARVLTLKAVELQPNSPLALVQRARVLYYAGWYDQARDDIREALALDSTFARAHLFGAVIDLASGQQQRGLGKLQAIRALTTDPEPVLLALLGHALAINGQRAAARAQLDTLAAARRLHYVPAELFAGVHVALGDNDAAFAELERAYRERSSGLVYLNVEPLIAPLSQDPRFRQLSAKVHPRR